MTVNTLYLGLLIATIAQSALLITALLTFKQGNKTANYLLSGIIALFSYYILVKILCRTELIRDYPHLIRTYMPLPFLIWAGLYFYTKAMTNPAFRFEARDSVHLLPFGLYTLSSVPFFLADGATKLQSWSAPPTTLNLLSVTLQGVVLFFYLALSYRILRNHHQRVKDVFSNLEKVKLDWLKYLLAAFGIIWAAAFIGFVARLEYRADLVVPPILLVLTIYAIGFYALKQPEIFKDVGVEAGGQPAESPVASATVRTRQADRPSKPGRPARYEYSGLTSEELSAYGRRLTEYLEREKPYTNNELKLQELADPLGVPSYQLSQIISVELRRNFYDLINSYRIEEAKRRITEPANQDLTILAIAYDVGFNSKSAFNAAFKKYTKMTPSQFKRSRPAAPHS